MIDRSTSAKPDSLWTHAVLRYGLAAMCLATALMAPGVEFVLNPDRAFRPGVASLGWDRLIIALHLVSDLLIGLAYVAISATLIVLARQAGQRIPFLWTFIAFGTFIIACGLTHFIAALTLWAPVYWAAAAVKIVTAVASVATAIAVPPLVPKVLHLIDNARLSEGRRQALTERNGELVHLNEALAASERRIRALIANAVVGVAVRDIEGSYITVNGTFARMLGCTEGELEASNVHDVTHPDDLHYQLALDNELLQGERDSYLLEKRYVRPDGRRAWARLHVSLVRDDAGRPLHFMQIIEDISDRRAADEALRHSRAQFQTAFAHAPIGLGLVAPDGTWVRVNDALCTITGYEPGDLLHHSLDDLAVPGDRRTDIRSLVALLTADAPTLQLQQRCTRKDGTLIWIQLSASTVLDLDGRPLHYIFQIQDITEQKRIHEELETLLAERTATLKVVEYRALHDPLTDLPNRTLLHDRLSRVILGARRTLTPFALLLMDLDGFKHVNDTLGHHIGDQLLQESALRIRSAVRESDTVARLGGDEFAIVLPCATEVDAHHVARKILHALDARMELGGHAVRVAGSVGIALYPEHGDDTGELLRRADVAMYEAKRTGSGSATYTVDSDYNSHSRLTFIAELRDVVDGDHLTMHYQPIVDALTGRIQCLEALVRWEHPERGLIPPDQFIPIAEQAGCIQRLTHCVLQQVIRQIADWHRAGIPGRVAVNLSPVNLLDADLAGIIGGLLAEHGVDPGRLILEVTETAVMEAAERTLPAVRRLHDIGVRLALDDFGTGYSSLAHLARLPVHLLKVDRSFVTDLSGSGQDHFIVRSIAELGHNLGLTVVAEGVETQQAMDVLVDIGCDAVQGFLVSHPLPARDIEAWMRQRQMVAADA